MTNPIGIALGQVLPTIFVTDTGGMPILFLVEAIIATATFLLAFFIKSKPDTPPSHSQAQKELMLEDGLESSTQMFRDAKQLLSNKNFLLLLGGFGIGLGLFNGLSTLIEQIVRPCGYTSDDAGYFGAVIIGAGLVGAGIVGPVMDATKAYNRILKLGILFSSSAVLFFVFVLQRDSFGLVLASFSCLGLCMVPLLPVSFECGVECSYPVAEDSSAGFLMLSGNLLGMSSIFLMDYLIGLDETCTTRTNPVGIFLLVMMAVGCLIVFFYKGEYRRLDAEKR